MLATILGLVILIVRLFPETPFGLWLHHWFVELPLALAHRVERRHIILVAIILCAGQSLALLGSAELAMAYAVDVSIYADAVLATSIATAMARLKGMWWALKQNIVRFIMGILRLSVRSNRKKPTIPRLKKPGNDDDPDGDRLARAA